MGSTPLNFVFNRVDLQRPSKRGQRRRALRFLQLTSIQQVDPERWKRSAATLSGMECHKFFRREATHTMSFTVAFSVNQAQATEGETMWEPTWKSKNEPRSLYG